ncbi:type II toxin-antitoxin system RelE/ParE family toxin [Streptomyces sp. JJ66]|uniref:type II toxin-antitoxin system RelE family toxin n=1 Tax=Streptomyces sp. JJ66 TaxID=2803843 RepID=UPI001C55FE40|nr:type II toxin-antitoxin system RelE/ParE family toxin [Streptomyces sp. JJ66]MBW1603652.1 type II toxin-antitoxin system RelE/ParE family toxin [Streptomyces sp. JJ66]
MSYSLTFTSHARRQLDRLDGSTKRRLRMALEKLTQDPFAPGLDVKKLRGAPSYRLRVGDYRVVYEIDNAVVTITVIEVDHRRNVYR